MKPPFESAETVKLDRTDFYYLLSTIRSIEKIRVKLVYVSVRNCVSI